MSIIIKNKFKKKGRLEWIQENGKGRGGDEEEKMGLRRFTVSQREQKNGPIAGSSERSRLSFCRLHLKPEVLLLVVFDPGEREVWWI